MTNYLADQQNTYVLSAFVLYIKFVSFKPATRNGNKDSRLSFANTYSDHRRALTATEKERESLAASPVAAAAAEIKARDSLKCGK